MKRILCPTDFSETANQAIAYAAKFAQVIHAELVLFHVQSLYDLSPVELIKGESEAIGSTHNILEKQSLEVAHEFKISCYSEVMVSGETLSTVISEKADDFDMVVMGSKGADDLFGFFFGSNTLNVVRKANVPILLVPDRLIFSGYKKIVFAYDYLRQGLAPIYHLIEWLTPFKSELHLLQILEESESKELDKELQEQQEIIRFNMPPEFPIHFDAIHAHDLSRSIHQYMIDKEADMLVLTTHHYSFMEKLFHKSVTKVISTVADYPVFIFPSNGKDGR